MFNEITESVLQVIAGDIEKLLLEKREGIAFAYKKIPDGIKISIGVNIDPSTKGIEVNYTISFPMEPAPEPAIKETIKFKHIVNEAQVELFGKIQRGEVQVSIPEN